VAGGINNIKGYKNLLLGCCPRVGGWNPRVAVLLPNNKKWKIIFEKNHF
jgi:hypothetical protein